MTIGAYLRALRVTLDEVLVELDDESELMTVGSDDEFDDMTCAAPAPPTQRQYTVQADLHQLELLVTGS
jgi:hypothetical protein